ncbi:MAG: precorrin-6Y C5,15-methyltransferase (decarboxylating) subunit CbiT [Pseudomonadota bacterium]
MTKREVRAATLAKLMPMNGGLLWDVGAGSGSIGIEWLRADRRRARAIAIEPVASRVETIARNAAALGAPQIDIRQAKAPDIFDDLPDPDAIFLGGGLSSKDVFAPAWARLKPGGRLVANAVTLESEAVLLSLWQANGGDLVRIAVNRAEPVGPYHGWRPLMPVTQWALVKS